MGGGDVFKGIKKNIDAMKKIIRGTLIICPYCKGMEVSHTKPEVDITQPLRLADGKQVIFRTEKYHINCKSCGKYGQIEETWVEQVIE